MTYNDIITRSMRLIGALLETETPSAEQGADALRQLNSMVAFWESDGVKIGYFPGAQPSDTLSLSPEYLLALEYNLAALLTASYERQVPPVVAMMATEAYSRLLRAAVYGNRVEARAELPEGEASLRSLSGAP